MVQVKTKLSFYPTLVVIKNGYLSVASGSLGLSQQEDIELPQIHLIEVTNGYFFSRLRITYGIEEREIIVNKLSHADAQLVRLMIEKGQQDQRQIIDY